jgi:hypothetical protein
MREGFPRSIEDQLRVWADDLETLVEDLPPAYQVAPRGGGGRGRVMAAAAAAAVVVAIAAVALLLQDAGAEQVPADAGTVEVAAGQSFRFEGDDCWVEPTYRERIDHLADLARQMPGVSNVVVVPPVLEGDVAAERWADGTGLEVFLDLSVEARQLEDVRLALSDEPDVDDSRVRFVARDEQYQLFRRYFQDQPEYLENVDAEDIPESFRVATVRRDGAIVELDGLVYTARTPGETVIVLENACRDQNVARAVRVIVN